MPQVAQQDYIQIKVESYDSPTAEEKAEIRKHVQNGTIWDVLIETDSAVGRVVGVSVVSRQIMFYTPGDGEIVPIDYE